MTRDKEARLVGSKPLKDFEKTELEFENLIASRYNHDYHEPPIMQAHSKDFVEYVSSYVHSGDRLLDLGCGPASLWSLWKGELPPLALLCGVDLSDGMISQASRLYPEDEFKVGSFLDIPYESGTFDVVVVSSAFHHLPDAVLPDALKEISRVLDEHGKLIGREPLRSGRLADKGGWFAGAIMHFRHLVYRLTHTREYPEPDPGPHHHAYDARDFLTIIQTALKLSDVSGRHPFSPYVSRCRNTDVAAIAKFMDEMLSHKEGQELYYVAEKNFSSAADVEFCIEQWLKQNEAHNVREFLAVLQTASTQLELILKK